MAKNEAVFLSINCIDTHSRFYARYDFSYDEMWVLSYGVKEIPQDTLGNCNSVESAKIDLLKSRIGPQYKCPFCGNKEFVRCGKCAKLTCYSGMGMFKCDYCGNTGNVDGTIGIIEGDKANSQGYI